MPRVNPLVSFVAGLGTGYFSAEKAKQDKERQDKLDQITFDKAQRDTEEYADKKALEDKLSSVPTVDNQSKINLDAQGLQGTMPAAFDSTDQAQAFLDNQDATPTQKAAALNSTAQAAAKMGITGADMGGQQIVAGDNGGVATSDPAQDVQRPTWQVMQDRSRVYLASGKPEYADAATKMLEQSQKMKSQDYQQRILQAKQSGGLDGLLNLMHEHDNNELGIVNPKIEYSQDGKTAYLVGQTPDGQPISSDPNDRARTFDLKNGSVEDQLTQNLLAMSSPAALGSHIINQVQQDRANRKDDLDERKVDVSEKKIAAAEQNAANHEDRRDTRQQIALDAMDQRQSRQLDAIAARSENAGKKVSLPQQANNAEIQLARKLLGGMTTEDVKAKTQPYLPNGRDNPNYDPTIAHAYHNANQRMVGDDPQFDQFLSSAQPIKQPSVAQGGDTPAQRFKADPTMHGMSMGKFTGKGWEVRDGNGQLVGHWQ